MNTKNEALELTQIDFGGDCDTPPEPWSAIWVAWNSEDGFTFWATEKQAALWSAADSNEWPVQYAMQKAQPAAPLTDRDLASACLSYRHDFGLMDETNRGLLMFQAREWARAFGLSTAAAPEKHQP
jgi:hypothetical protein